MSSLTKKSRQFDRRETGGDIQVSLEVNMDSRSNFYAGITGNLSEGGLFVATDQLHSVGTFLQLQFLLPGSDEPIVTVGEVRWHSSGETAVKGTAGMGVRFLNLRDTDRARIEAFVKQRETLFYDDEEL